MPNFGIWEWITILTIVATIFVACGVMLPRAIAEFIKAVQKHL